MRLCAIVYRPYGVPPPSLLDIALPPRPGCLNIVLPYISLLLTRCSRVEESSSRKTQTLLSREFIFRIFASGSFPASPRSVSSEESRRYKEDFSPPAEILGWNKRNTCIDMFVVAGLIFKKGSSLSTDTSQLVIRSVQHLKINFGGFLKCKARL